MCGMKFSKKTDYAIALIDALKLTYFSDTFTGLSQIAEKNRLPKMFLEKVAHILRDEGILMSHKGVHGGYRLARDPSALTLHEVINIFERTSVMARMRPPKTSKECPVAKFSEPEKRWRDIDTRINSIFKEITFA